MDLAYLEQFLYYTNNSPNWLFHIQSEPLECHAMYTKALELLLGMYTRFAVPDPLQP